MLQSIAQTRFVVSKEIYWNVLKKSSALLDWWQKKENKTNKKKAIELGKWVKGTGLNQLSVGTGASCFMFNSFILFMFYWLKETIFLALLHWENKEWILITIKQKQKKEGKTSPATVDQMSVMDLVVPFKLIKFYKLFQSTTDVISIIERLKYAALIYIVQRKLEFIHQSGSFVSNTFMFELV